MAGVASKFAARVMSAAFFAARYDGAPMEFPRPVIVSWLLAFGAVAAAPSIQ
jgi:hypothetical protein